jgi:P-type Ca2+ transporter type 2A
LLFFSSPIAGDQIPADSRLAKVTSTSLRVDQSALTGESVTVSKEIEVVRDHSATIQDKTNLVFSGTNVTMGRGICIVTATGENAELGKIRRSIRDAEGNTSPLQKQLDDFSAQLSIVIMVICIVVWLINIGHFTDPVFGGWARGAVYYFKIAVALAVAAIPEGLPAVVTTCLALGTRKMAAKKAIVRHLPSVETLGCTTVICSDKTGTLTTNAMVVQAMYTMATTSRGNAYEVSGIGFDPRGDISPAVGSSAALSELSRICSLCNDAHISYQDGEWRRQGEPTEAALKVLAEKIGHPGQKTTSSSSSRGGGHRTKLEEVAHAVSDAWGKGVTRLATLEFSRKRKSMSVIVSGGESMSITSPSGSGKAAARAKSPAARAKSPAARRAKSPGPRSPRSPSTGRSRKSAAAVGGSSAAAELLCKGAPESVIPRCSTILLANGQVETMTEKHRKMIYKQVDDWATNRALRILACAVRRDFAPNSLDLHNPDNHVRAESEMTFVGLTGMMDPPRLEVADAIKTCHMAGIRVIVITGDNKDTATAVCKSIGLLDQNVSSDSEFVVTGKEFDVMTSRRKEQVLKQAVVFARVEPQHKYDIVELLQKAHGEIVAMTGDGVNDAPALKRADIGVAMGSGTAVARGSSDMVLADDNFSTIVAAVDEGRVIYANTKQFIRYLISSNIGEVVSIFLTAALGMPEALAPVQLLWVNLVTDGLPATALSFNSADPENMTNPPRRKDEAIINGWTFLRYLIIGGYVGVATVAGFVHWYLWYEGSPAISWSELTSFHSCGSEGSTMPADFDCSIFSDARPCTVSLSILVTIEMLNALNSLSENASLLTLPPWNNPTLCFAVALSMALHFVLLYVPWIAAIFNVSALNYDEWMIVLLWSAPVILIDEVLKFIGRCSHQVAGKKKVD